MMSTVYGLTLSPSCPVPARFVARSPFHRYRGWPWPRARPLAQPSQKTPHAKPGYNCSRRKELWRAAIAEARCRTQRPLASRLPQCTTRKTPLSSFYFDFGVKAPSSFALWPSVSIAAVALRESPRPPKAEGSRGAPSEGNSPYQFPQPCRSLISLQLEDDPSTDRLDRPSFGSEPAIHSVTLAGVSVFELLAALMPTARSGGANAVVSIPRTL